MTKRIWVSKDRYKSVKKAADKANAEHWRKYGCGDGANIWDREAHKSNMNTPLARRLYGGNDEM